MKSIEEFKGKIFTDINVNSNKDEVIFTDSLGKQYKMYHRQDCCEGVSIEDINGELSDLLNSPILEASERTNSEDNKPSEYSESWTWTFYHLATIKGYVVIRWLGESNGYYSESVDIVELGSEEDY